MKDELSLKDAPLFVSSETRISRFKILPGPLLYMEREMNLANEVIQTIAYATGWCMFSQAGNNNAPGSIAARVNDQWLPLTQNCRVFIPPFSVVEWRFRPGRIRFKMCLSPGNPPESWPMEPCVFQEAEAFDPPMLETQMEKLLKTKSPCSLNRAASSCPVSRKAKTFIDETYEKDIDVAKMATFLGFNHTAMSRRFKTCYGITPVQYRNLLRVMKAQELLLLQKMPVGEAAGSCGFDDFSAFYRNFKRHTEVKPSTYLGPKK